MRRKQRLALFLILAIACVSGQNCGLPYHADPTFGASIFASAAEAGIQCVDPNVQGATPLKRLNKAQYVNTLNDLFGTAIVQTVQTDVDAISDDMKFESADSYVKEFYQSTIQSQSSIAEKLGTAVSVQSALQTRLGAGSCMSGSTPTAQCMSDFISVAGAKFWRRPLLANEISDIQTLLTSATAKEDKLSITIAYFLQSPNFTYLIESGSTPANAYQGSFQLTNYEIASRISYLVVDSMPDSTLVDLAKTGQLQDRSIQINQINRLFQDSRAREKVARFVKYWLMLSGTSHSMRDFPTGPAEFVNGIDGPTLKIEVVREIQEYVNFIVFDQHGTYRDLMTSNASFARTDALAAVYGHSKVVANLPSAMPQRKGLLSRPVFLANSSSETSTIIRGVRMRARILCVDAIAPGVDITSQGPDVTTEDMIRKYSTRERFDLKVSQTACAGCHAAINPFGNAFENFDSFGRLRPLEIDYRSDSSRIAVHPIDTAVQVAIGHSTLALKDADELQTTIAQSPEGQACLAKQTFRFYQLQNEAADDACTLSAIYSSVANPNGTILDGLKAFVLANITTKRVN